MIDTSAKLQAFLPALERASWVGIDTEADSLHSYPEKLCLIQLSLPPGEVLIDPLAGFDLGPLFEGLRDKEILLHGGDYDLRLLYRGHGFVPDRVFDTLNAARLIGRHEFGLHHLVKEFLGIQLSKSSQKADWSIRPLTPVMIEYALCDARYLKPLVDCLRHRLESLGRLEWHGESCRQLVSDSARPAPEPERPAWYIKGAARLHGRSLAVLRELWQWRESEAVRMNRPPFFVLDHDRLLRLAEDAAAGNGFDDLIPRRYSQSRRRGVFQAVERGLRVPRAEWPVITQARGTRMTEAQKRRFEQLRERRDEAARRLRLDPSIVASKSDLLALSVRSSGGVDGIVLPWQARLLLDPP
ncbi:MAG: HRDC domain-containing protein [Verrucomicrobiales bacterium]|nr:HRDC domain-containing protein [Verrucomicrobiales bacterium]